MKPVPPTMTYIGIAVAAAGFVVIMFSWGEVAALTNVPLQMPYLLSGGFVGLGLILTGLTLVNVNAKRIDGAARDRQLGQVREVLAEIKTLLGGEPEVIAEPEATEVAEEESAAADHTEPLPTVSGANGP